MLLAQSFNLAGKEFTLTVALVSLSSSYLTLPTQCSRNMISIYSGSSLIGRRQSVPVQLISTSSHFFMICIMIGRGPINISHHPLLTRWLTCNKPLQLSNCHKLSKQSYWLGLKLKTIHTYQMLDFDLFFFEAVNWCLVYFKEENVLISEKPCEWYRNKTFFAFKYIQHVYIVKHCRTSLNSGLVLYWVCYHQR